MDTDNIKKALGKLHQVLLPIRQSWFIIGTSSLMLAGYDILPDDIDVLTDKTTANQIDDLLKAFKAPVKLKDEGKFRSVFSRYVIDGVSIEVMGSLQVNIGKAWVDVLPLITDPHEVKLSGARFFVPSKTDHIKIYTLFGRPKDQLALTLLNSF